MSTYTGVLNFQTTVRFFGPPCMCFVFVTQTVAYCHNAGPYLSPHPLTTIDLTIVHIERLDISGFNRCTIAVVAVNNQVEAQ